MEAVGRRVGEGFDGGIGDRAKAVLSRVRCLFRVVIVFVKRL